MRPVPFWLVHHANQSLLTEGYEDREGIAKIAQGYAGVLQLHAQYGIPCALHLSGTLIEALAWGCPWFISFVNKLRRDGILELCGGTYSENIIPLTDEGGNRRQLREFLEVFGRHFGGAESLSWFWVPERVWDTGLAAPLLRDPQLPNGGYRGVFLDRRLLLPNNAPGTLSRADGDGLGPWRPEPALLSHRLSEWPASHASAWRETLQLHRMENGLEVVPISEHLRYWVPFREPSDAARVLDLAKVTEGLAHPVLLFADDLERTAGVAGWDPSGLRRFAEFLPWLAERSETRAELPRTGGGAKFLAALEPGSFYEFEHEIGGGPDGRGFLESAEGRRAAETLENVRRSLALDVPADAPLLDLAQKHLLVSQYETHWHDRAGKMAPWANALASQSRHSLTIAAAARWFAAPGSQPNAVAVDLDGDGETELVLRNEHLFAVISAARGARLVALFYRSKFGGTMMIGNPSDDWNLQCELHRFMRVPANHPGAFADLDGEDDRYAAAPPAADPDGVSVALVNQEAASPWYGLSKTFSLAKDSSALSVRYRVPGGAPGQSTVSLSPDYLELLRQGRGVAETDETEFRVRTGRAVARLVVVSGATLWPEGTIGHGWKARLENMQREIEMEVRCSTT